MNISTTLLGESYVLRIFFRWDMNYQVSLHHGGEIILKYFHLNEAQDEGGGLGFSDEKLKQRRQRQENHVVGIAFSARVTRFEYVHQDSTTNSWQYVDIFSTATEYWGIRHSAIGIL